MVIRCGFWMVMIILIITSHECYLIMCHDDGGVRCIEEERKSLLEFKAAWLPGMNSWAIDSVFNSWVDDHHRHNCCDWERVSCDPVTGHVLQLSLSDILYSTGNMEAIATGIQKLSTLKQLENLDISGNQLVDSILPSLSTLKSLKKLSLGRNYLFKDDFSSKGLESLQQIRELDMSSCRLTNKDVEKLSALRQLESLNIECEPLLKLKKLEGLFLSYNTDDDHIDENKKINVSCLGSLPSLRRLSLSNNNFMDGLHEVLGLESLQQIEDLDLSDCDLTSKGGDGVMRSFSKMTKLRNVDLSWNHFEKDVLVALGALPSLQSLNLSYNPSIEGPLTNLDLIGFHHLEILNLASCRLNGTIPAQSFCKMNKLQKLDLSYNSLQGDIPICLKELSFLKYFSIYKNQLNGNISLSLFRDLNSLEYIDLRDNSLQGSLSLKTFANFSKLEDVLISSYSDKLVVESDVVDWVPKFQLKSLMLSNCNLKEFPKFLLYQKHLQFFNLSHNKVEGSFPDWLLVNNTELNTLSMRNNNLVEGNIFSNLFNRSIGGRRYLNSIDISYNNMSGQIPITTTTTNRSIFVDLLAMRGNSFSGPFPCHLVGTFYYLDISYNSFSGELPADCSSFTYSSHLNLYGNRFTGLIPETIFNSSGRVTLDIGNNCFSGRIPTHLNHSTNLQVLSLRGNNLSGEIPHELCQLKRLNWLDLSHNSFSGSIPTCLGNMITLGENTDILDGTLKIEDGGSTIFADNPADVLISTKYRVDSYSGELLSLMSGLDLSSNNLEGEIPNGLGNLIFIHALNLSHNCLSGPIPQTFSNLMQIESLDLSHNNLSGEIPSNLVNLNFMETFSVAYNNLSGRLPDMMKGQFGSFEGDSYAGNPFLCGPPLKKDCSKVKKDDGEDEELHGHEEAAWYTTIDREEFYASFMATYIVYILGFITVLWINTRWRNRWFNFIENILFSSYYFLSDALFKCFKVRI
ncbi:receptor-like protein 56 isoform X2 [Impatiens glandulifera]|uniref:receptor-like protein 56 isoform X2 n=1 Tax=Impatiens glandulifera TaxID=253017 RepID=UPI001FB0BA82|nr:receptor-like protein 56 isoform X2 [Impatiens glandulifera]